jgi:hypothetical protein
MIGMFADFKDLVLMDLLPGFNDRNETVSGRVSRGRQRASRHRRESERRERHESAAIRFEGTVFVVESVCKSRIKGPDMHKSL